MKAVESSGTKNRELRKQSGYLKNYLQMENIQSIGGVLPIIDAHVVALRPYRKPLHSAARRWRSPGLGGHRCQPLQPLSAAGGPNVGAAVAQSRNTQAVARPPQRPGQALTGPHHWLLAAHDDTAHTTSFSPLLPAVLCSRCAADEESSLPNLSDFVDRCANRQLTAVFV